MKTAHGWQIAKGFKAPDDLLGLFAVGDEEFRECRDLLVGKHATAFELVVEGFDEGLVVKGSFPTFGGWLPFGDAGGTLEEFLAVLGGRCALGALCVLFVFHWQLEFLRQFGIARNFCGMTTGETADGGNLPGSERVGAFRLLGDGAEEASCIEGASPVICGGFFPFDCLHGFQQFQEGRR